MSKKNQIIMDILQDMVDTADHHSLNMTVRVKEKSGVILVQSNYHSEIIRMDRSLPFIRYVLSELLEYAATAKKNPLEGMKHFRPRVRERIL